MLPCPGYSDEVIHCFLARELTLLENPQPVMTMKIWRLC